MRVWLCGWVLVVWVSVSLERGWQMIIADVIDKRYSISVYWIAFSKLNIHFTQVTFWLAFWFWVSVGFSEAKLGWNYGSNRIRDVFLRLCLPIDTNRYLYIDHLSIQLCFDKRSSHNKNNLYFRKGEGRFCFCFCFYLCFDSLTFSASSLRLSFLRSLPSAFCFLRLIR